MQFKKYNSIENTYNLKNYFGIKDERDREMIDNLLSEKSSTQFVVQEKVHGCNLCFITDGVSVQCGSREHLFTSDENFYNWQELLSRYRPAIINLFDLINSNNPEIETMIVYGEMFGGYYPHRDVQKIANVSRIQKGVFYCPNHEFYAFDILLIFEEAEEYLPVDDADELFRTAGLFYAQSLFTGSLRKCLEYPNDFQSKIPEWFGLPLIENNICEGVVIRPVEPIFLRTGARLLLKSKNDKFAEKKSEKKHLVVPKEEVEYSKELTNLLEIIENYITENRLDNVVSKIGEVSIPKDIGKLIGLLSKDAIEDIAKENKHYDLLDKNEQRVLHKQINDLSANLIKKIHLT
jgi:Rnl2 family RNA ligase